MMNSNDVSDMVDEGKAYVEQEVTPRLKEGKEQIKQSGKDWWSYVENHPLQTLLFGVIGYFAVKGILKE